jgi:hypothetical protein
MIVEHALELVRTFDDVPENEQEALRKKAACTPLIEREGTSSQKPERFSLLLFDFIL